VLSFTTGRIGVDWSRSSVSKCNSYVGQRLSSWHKRSWKMKESTSVWVRVHVLMCIHHNRKKLATSCPCGSYALASLRTARNIGQVRQQWVQISIHQRKQTMSGLFNDWQMLCATLLGMSTPPLTQVPVTRYATGTWQGGRASQLPSLHWLYLVGLVERAQHQLHKSVKGNVRSDERNSAQGELLPKQSCTFKKTLSKTSVLFLMR